MKTKIKHFYVRGEVDNDDGFPWLGEAIYHEPSCSDEIASYLEGAYIEKGVERIAAVVGKLCELLIAKNLCTREELLEIFDVDYWEDEVEIK